MGSLSPLNWVKMMKVVEVEQLSDKHFVKKKQGDNFIIEMRVSEQAGNTIEQKEDGFYAAAMPVNTFHATWTENVRGFTNHSYRRVLNTQGALGILHLHFTPTAEINKKTAIATLPETAPVPMATIEILTPDGGKVYLFTGARTVYATGLSQGKEYIADLVGFWK